MLVSKKMPKQCCDHTKTFRTDCLAYFWFILIVWQVFIWEIKIKISSDLGTLSPEIHHLEISCISTGKHKVVRLISFLFPIFFFSGAVGWNSSYLDHCPSNSTGNRLQEIRDNLHKHDTYTVHRSQMVLNVHVKCFCKVLMKKSNMQLLKKYQN